ncbi:MAG: carboxypeptidase-like regulatory domain-containing protein [Allomuricauda sp.]
MRIVTVMLILSSVPYFGFGQNAISGKIVDELGLPVYMATVEIHDTEDITHTDFDGSFSLNSEKDFHWKINIRSKGYKTESFFVLSGGSTGEIVLEYDAEMKKLLEGQ